MPPRIFFLLFVVPRAGSTPQPRAPPPMNNLLGEPAPPPPALVAGLRSLLLNVPGCDTPCLERGEDWFEQGMKWGASSVTSMVRLGYVDAFVGALALPPEGDAEVRRRCSEVVTTLTPKDDL